MCKHWNTRSYYNFSCFTFIFMGIHSFILYEKIEINFHKWSSLFSWFHLPHLIFCQQTLLILHKKTDLKRESSFIFNYRNASVKRTKFIWKNFKLITSQFSVLFSCPNKSPLWRMELDEFKKNNKKNMCIMETFHS